MHFENSQIYQLKLKMAAVTMVTKTNNKVLMIISSKFDLAELIGNHYLGIGGKIKQKVTQGLFPCPHLPPLTPV